MRPVLPLLAVLVVAGCGGGSQALPGEDPGVTLTRLVRFELAGKLERSYAMLVREQRELVDRGLYVSCRPGMPTANAHVSVLGVADETYDVPAVGTTATKAITYRMTFAPKAAEPVSVSDKAHLVAQDGEWRWTLSAKSLARYRNGTCP